MKGDNYRHQVSGSWFGGLLWMVSGGAIAVACLLGFNNFQLGDRLFSALNTLITPKTQEPQVDVRSLILQQVREASELTTAAFTMQAVVPTEQDAAVGGFVFGKTRLLYIAYGEVKAGVDLSQITAKDVQVGNDTIQLQLPAAQILDRKIDVNKSQVYDYDRGMLGLGPDTGPELQTLAQQKALEKITMAACEEGLLEKANDRAKLVVTQLLSTAGYKSVVVNSQPVVSPGQACLSPPTNKGVDPINPEVPATSASPQ